MVIIPVEWTIFSASVLINPVGPLTPTGFTLSCRRLKRKHRLALNVLVVQYAIRSIAEWLTHPINVVEHEIHCKHELLSLSLAYDDGRELNIPAHSLDAERNAIPLHAMYDLLHKVILEVQPITIRRCSISTTPEAGPSGGRRRRISDGQARNHHIYSIICIEFRDPVPSPPQVSHIISRP